MVRGAPDGGLRRFAACLVVVASAASCTSSTSSVTDPGDDAGPAGDADAGDHDVGPHSCHGEAESIRVGNAQTLDPIIEAPDRCVVYGIDRSGGEVFFVSTETDRLQLTVQVGSRPSDLTLSADGTRLYVAVLGEPKIVELDAITGALIREVPTEVPPYRIARGPGQRAYFVAEGTFTAVHEVDLRTGLVEEVTGEDFHEPDLEATADGTSLYLGEANTPTAELLRFDTSTFGVPAPGSDRFRFDGGFGLPSPQRRIVLSESAGRMYFADRAFEATDLARVRGWLGGQVVAATGDGRIVATGESLYDAATFVRFATRLHPGGGAHFSADGRWLYEFDATGSQLHRTRIETLIGVHQLGATQVPAGTLAEHDFTLLIADPNPLRPLLYGLDTQNNEVVFIDRETQHPLRAEIIGSSPTDVAVHPGSDLLVVATFGATEVAVLDLSDTSKSKEVLQAPGNPYRITSAGDGRIVYVEQDELTDMTLLEREAAGESLTVPGAVYQPDVEFDPNGDFLYVGESAREDARLFKIDMRTPPFDIEGAMQSPVTVDFPIQQVIANGGFVYWAGRKFDAETLALIDDFGDDIIVVTPAGDLALSRTKIYGTDCFCELGGLPRDSPLIAVDPQSEIVYQFDNSTGALFVQALP